MKEKNYKLVSDSDEVPNASDPGDANPVAEAKQHHKFSVSELRLSDYSQLPDLWTNSGIDWSDVDTEDKFARLLSRNVGVNGTCYSSVVRLENRIVGVLLCGDDGLCAYIYHVAVHAEFRRYGLGTMLAQRTLAELQSSGVRECRLFVRYVNEIGGAFWESLGFTPRVGIYSMSAKFQR